MMKQTKQQFHHSFMEIFIIAAWQIWKQRNNFIFDRGHPSLESWKHLFCEETRLQACRICEDKRQEFLLCIDYPRFAPLLELASPVLFLCVLAWVKPPFSNRYLQWGAPMLYFTLKKKTFPQGHKRNHCHSRPSLRCQGIKHKTTWLHQ